MCISYSRITAPTLYIKYKERLIVLLSLSCKDLSYIYFLRLDEIANCNSGSLHMVLLSSVDRTLIRLQVQSTDWTKPAISTPFTTTS